MQASAARSTLSARGNVANGPLVLSLLALLAQKYKYSHLRSGCSALLALLAQKYKCCHLRSGCCRQEVSQFTCFTGAKVQILTPRSGCCRQELSLLGRGARRGPARWYICFTGTNVLAFTGTKVLFRNSVLSAEEQDEDQHAGTQFTCFTGTKAQILTYC
jgi:hypothetical protein